jgi:hypothetical protein
MTAGAETGTVSMAEMTTFALMPLLSPRLAVGTMSLVYPGRRLDPEAWV